MRLKNPVYIYIYVYVNYYEDFPKQPPMRFSRSDSAGLVLKIQEYAELAKERERERAGFKYSIWLPRLARRRDYKLARLRRAFTILSK